MMFVGRREVVSFSFRKGSGDPVVCANKSGDIHCKKFVRFEKLVGGGGVGKKSLG